MGTRFTNNTSVHYFQNLEGTVFRSGWVIALVLAVIGANCSLVAAQDSNLDAIGEVVMQADPETLVTNLQQTPIRNAVLPSGFDVPPNGELVNKDLVESFTSAIDTVDGSVGVAHVGVDVDRRTIPAAIAAGVITYVVFDEEITATQFRTYENGLRDAFASDETYTSKVEKISLGGSDGIHISVTSDEDGVSVVVDLVSVPVGNVILLAMVILADQTVIDSSSLEPHTRDLTLSGAAWLGSLAEHGESPASPEATPDKYRDKFGWSESMAAA